jgi:hypothetical protein
VQSSRREGTTHALKSVLMEFVSTSVMPVSDEMHPWQASSWVVWVELGQMQEMTPESLRSGHSRGSNDRCVLAVFCPVLSVPPSVDGTL